MKETLIITAYLSTFQFFKQNYIKSGHMKGLGMIRDNFASDYSKDFRIRSTIGSMSISRSGI